MMMNILMMTMMTIVLSVVVVAAAVAIIVRALFDFESISKMITKTLVLLMLPVLY